MCEVDVFEHHRFCDEFSHLVLMYVLLRLEDSVEGSISWNICFKWFKCSVELSNSLYSCQKCFPSVWQLCEVDVFEHHRFCDEFSHLVNGCFVATRRLCWRLNFMEYMFQMI